jgi:hypothetical protein
MIYDLMYLEVEGLDEEGLLQGGGVAHTPHLDAIRVAAHAQLGMLPHTTLHSYPDIRENRERGDRLVDTILHWGRHRGQRRGRGGGEVSQRRYIQ